MSISNPLLDHHGAFLQDSPIIGGHASGKLRWQEFCGAFAETVLPAEELLEAAIGKQDPAGLVFDEDAGGQMFHEFQEAPFAFGQRCFGSLALGDIHVLGHHIGQPASCISYGKYRGIEDDGSRMFQAQTFQP